MQSTNISQYSPSTFRETVKLSDGRVMPLVGLGTWKMVDQAVLDHALDAALEGGYRHIDCAELYENEGMVGQALAKAMAKHGVTRVELWITSKVPHYAMDYETAKECIRNSVTALTGDENGYLDLALIHWPTSILAEPGLENRLAVWRAFEEVKTEGRVKSIGVSNFTVRHL
jgi:diketogulonate reductase-like aldo/keto reductase